MLHARVVDWSRAFSLKMNELPPIHFQSNTVCDPQLNIVSQSESKPPCSAVDQSTRTSTKENALNKSARYRGTMTSSTASTSTNVELPERMPFHYCIPINHRNISVWKFEAALEIELDSVVWRVSGVSNSRTKIRSLKPNIGTSLRAISSEYT
jgi:hypothetical protein